MREQATSPSTIRLLERIEPQLGADEAAYRQHFLPTDTAHAKAAAWLVLALAAVVFAFELVSLPRDLVGQLVAVRVAFFTAAAVILVRGRRGATPAQLDRAALMFSVLFALHFVALFALRPASRIDEISVLLLILGAYALSPAPLAQRAVAPALIAAGSVFALWLTRGTEPVMLWPTAMLLLAANALGFWGSARLHTQRRRQYQAQEHLRLSLKERDALIDRLRQAHKMESMGRIVGGVAHDFNNILGAMFVAVEFLLEDLPPHHPSRPDAEAIRDSTRRAADLTRQLLAFSRQQVLEPRVVSLNDLITDTKRMLERTIGEHVTITASLDRQLAAVRVDPGQVQQILMNLAVNARDAMPNGGTLLLHTQNTHLTDAELMAHSVAPPGAYVVLTVTDSGTGMDETTVAKIFEPFFTTKPKGRGTGLGLSTVFGIVEQSGGHIRVRSVPGRGTTFDVFLPAVAEAPSSIAPQADAAGDARGTETILLAEDDGALRELLARVLASHGYRVLQATDGADALRVADQHDGPLHLLASDVVMPNMGGQRLAVEMMERRRGIKVLLMSGYTDDAFADGQTRPGDAFLQKPFDPFVMARQVRTLLDAN